MISVCVAIYDNDIACLQYLLGSLEHNSSLISEILIADFNWHGKSQDRSFALGSVPVHQFKYDYDFPTTDCFSHAIGLHQCINQSKNDYLLFLDHDVIILCKDFDRFFFDIFNNYDLMMLGIEHYVEDQAFLRFPTITTALVRKSQLPNPDFLAGQLKYRQSIQGYHNRSADDYPIESNNFFLLQTPIPSKMSLFPNPTGIYDVGCNLWVWLFEQKGRWLSFENSFGKGPAIYTSRNVNNFGLNDDFGSKNLLFHCGMHENRLEILNNFCQKIV